MGMLLILLALNFGISWLNCWSVGRSWYEARSAGGWARLLTWCGAVQAAIGFSRVIGFAIGGALHLAGKLPPAAAAGAVSLWYLLVIVPVLSTGLVILVESWRAAWRDRSFGNLATAAYNTAAMGSNLYGASDGIGKALDGVKSLFAGEDEGGSKIAVMAFCLALAAIASGVILTVVLIGRYSERRGRVPSFARA